MAEVKSKTSTPDTRTLETRFDPLPSFCRDESGVGRFVLLLKEWFVVGGFSGFWLQLLPRVAIPLFRQPAVDGDTRGGVGRKKVVGKTL